MTALIVCALAGMVAASDTGALYVHSSRIVGHRDLSVVYRVDLRTKEFSTFYKRTESPTRVFSPVACPDGKHIAIGYMVEVDGTYGYQAEILNPSGDLVTSIRGASPSLAWSPDCSKIAYVSASYVSEEQVPTGVWIYDLEKRQARKMHDSGGHLTWAGFDGMIYISGREGGPPIRRLNPATGDVVETGYESLQFSPDGKYLFYLGLEGRNRLVLREDGTDISEAYEFLQQKENFGYPEWLSNDVVMLGAQAKTYHEYLFFCETGRAYMAPGLILALGKNGESVYISRYPEGEIEELPFDMLELKAKGESSEAIDAKVAELRKAQEADRPEESSIAPAEVD